MSPRSRDQNFRIRMLGGEHATQMSCEDANCEAHRKGWFMPLDVSLPETAKFATWAKTTGRRFFEWRAPNALEEALRREASGDITITPPLRAMLQSLAPGMVVLCFPPGQSCFKQHLDREVVFWHGQYVHANGRNFNEDMNESADRIGVLRKRG